MPFVVKVTGTGLSILWLAVCDSEGSYTFGSSKDAVVYPTQAEAQEAAATWRPTLTDSSAWCSQSNSQT